jgi:hypothetical protein
MPLAFTSGSFILFVYSLCFATHTHAGGSSTPCCKMPIIILSARCYMR